MNKKSGGKVVGQVIVIVVWLAVLVGLGVAIWYGLSRYKAIAQRSLQHAYETYHVHLIPQPGDVEVVYHTYHGLIAWVTQTEHRVALRPGDARRLLKRLLRFNLTWGLLSYGAVFIPALSLFEYWGQRRALRRQEETQGQSA